MPSTTRNDDVGTRLAAMEARLAELEEQDRANAAELAEEAIDRLVSRVFPAEARSHMRAARKEQLLAARSFIDHWIERLDRPAAPARRPRRPPASPRRRESIPLE
jgi:hypothetical protein